MTTTTSSSQRLRTEIPGPSSRKPQERRDASVAAGVSSTLPVFAERGQDGLVVDVDGNELIDLGSGISRWRRSPVAPW